MNQLFSTRNHSQCHLYNQKINLVNKPSSKINYIIHHFLCITCFYNSYINKTDKKYDKTKYFHSFHPSLMPRVELHMVLQELGLCKTCKTYCLSSSVDPDSCIHVNVTFPKHFLNHFIHSFILESI